MANIRDGIIIQTFFLSFSFFRTGVIWALWSNETGKGSLSKVVQRLKYYLYINFHQGRLNTCEVIVINFNDTYFFCFITSERNLSILVKVNCLPFISESCSAGLELLTYKFFIKVGLILMKWWMFFKMVLTALHLFFNFTA